MAIVTVLVAMMRVAHLGTEYHALTRACRSVARSLGRPKEYTARSDPFLETSDTIRAQNQAYTIEHGETANNGIQDCSNFVTPHFLLRT